MFKENKDHLQAELFDTISELPRRVQRRLENSWAASFYENVFCKIDEQDFARLYSEDYGRPNFPVNILVAFEILKHRHNLTDEEAFDQFYFNMQWRVALGSRNIGQDIFAERTLYDFRERLYRYSLQNPGEDDLIYMQFENITKHLKEVMGLDTSEMRTDSTQIMPNIKKAGRLSLSYDVLTKALIECPKDLLPEELLKILTPVFKRDLLYRTKSREIESRLKEMLHLCSRFLELVESTPRLQDLPSVPLVRRFLKDHTAIDLDSEELVVKPSNMISSDSLQSAHDPDATNRTKGRNNYSGYTANIFETCSDFNPVQIITDYTLEKNNVADTTMVCNRMEKVKENHDLEDLYADGGYYSEHVLDKAKDNQVEMHFTNMTGAAPLTMPVTQFIIEDDKIKQCPAGQEAKFSYIGKGGTLSARFDPKACSSCEYKSICPAKLGKKDAIVRITQKSLRAAKARDKINDSKQQAIMTSKRAAIEGTNSVLKRAYGIGKLAVRGINKSRAATGFKIIAHNIRQLERWSKGEYRRYPKSKKFLGSCVTPVFGN